MSKDNRLLLCTDLDRTLLPNGEQDESPAARELFRQLVKHPLITLVYVTGRNLDLVQQAIADYQLPVPDYAITDVGATIYTQQKGEFHSLAKWQHKIGEDWSEYSSSSLAEALGDFNQLQLQPASNQQRYKLSYQVQPSSLMLSELELVNQKLNHLTPPCSCQVVASVDETLDMGLVDLLPQGANKRKAIDFLMHDLGFEAQQVFFSGDSGNDLDVLVSHYPSVLVRNSTPDIQQQAQILSQKQGLSEYLYVAQGVSELKLNGHYCAGLLEGLFYFYPHYRDWLITE